MKNKTELFTELRQLVEISSITDNIKGVESAGQKFKDFLKKYPLDWSEVKQKGSAPFLIGRSKKIDKSKPMILLSGHTDVVYPFENNFKQDKEKLYGPGTQDMKAGLMVIIDAVRALEAQGLLQNIIIALNPEEEKSKTHKYKEVMINLAKEADYIFVFESTLDLNPKSSKNTHSVVLSRKGIYIGTIMVNGPGGHSGVITDLKQRVNTISILSSIIQKLESFANYKAGNTLNMAVIKGGDAYNIIPPTAELTFEYRFIQNSQFELFKKQLDSLLLEVTKKSQVKVVLNDKGPFAPLEKQPQSLQFFKVIQKIGRQNNIKVIPEDRGGRSDACWYQQGNPNAVVLDGFGVRGEHQHTKKEFIYKSSLAQSSVLMVEIIKKLFN